MNGCDYKITLGATTGGVPHTYGATIDIVCPAGKEITVTVWLSENAHTTEPNSPKCVLHVPSQNNLGGLHVTDTTNGTVHLTGTIPGITVKQTRNSILCPAGTHTATGEFHLNATGTGKNEAGGVTPISISHP
jgi:hypothetical protein